MSVEWWLTLGDGREWWRVQDLAIGRPPDLMRNHAKLSYPPTVTASCGGAAPLPTLLRFPAHWHHPRLQAAPEPTLYGSTAPLRCV